LGFRDWQLQGVKIKSVKNMHVFRGGGQKGSKKGYFQGLKTTKTDSCSKNYPKKQQIILTPQQTHILEVQKVNI
jgi:predicted component of type VI protein secretion system